MVRYDTVWYSIDEPRRNGLRPAADLFPHLATAQALPRRRALAVAAHPPLCVARQDDALSVVAELPGRTAADVEIVVEHDVLTLRGRELPAEAGEDVRVLRRERHRGAFERRLRVPFEIDAERVSARFADGLLTIRVAEPAANAPRTISIDTE